MINTEILKVQKDNVNIRAVEISGGTFSFSNDVVISYSSNKLTEAEFTQFKTASLNRQKPVLNCKNELSACSNLETLIKISS